MTPEAIEAARQAREDLERIRSGEVMDELAQGVYLLRRVTAYASEMPDALAEEVNRFLKRYGR